MGVGTQELNTNCPVQLSLHLGGREGGRGTQETQTVRSSCYTWGPGEVLRVGVRTQETQTVHSSCKQAYTWGPGEVLRVGVGTLETQTVQSSCKQAYTWGGGGSKGGRGTRETVPAASKPTLGGGGGGGGQGRF